MDKIRVIITNNQRKVKIPTGLRMLVRRCCHADEIHKLNKQYRNKDMPTDVLSFVMGENGVYDVDPKTGAQILGDVVISMEKAVEQAERYGHSLQREVGYLTAHSVLHLLGYDHENNMERIRMREKEEKVMSQLGLPASTSYVREE